MSTREQNTDGELDALTPAGCECVYVDKASGKLARRPEWDRCREQLRRGDALVVTKLDRLGRSVRHLIEVVGELRELGVELVVLAQGIDTTSPCGPVAVSRPGRDGRVRRRSDRGEQSRRAWPPRGPGAASAGDPR